MALCVWGSGAQMVGLKCSLSSGHLCMMSSAMPPGWKYSCGAPMLLSTAPAAPTTDRYCCTATLARSLLCVGACSSCLNQECDEWSCWCCEKEGNTFTRQEMANRMVCWCTVDCGFWAVLCNQLIANTFFALMIPM